VHRTAIDGIDFFVPGFQYILNFGCVALLYASKLFQLRKVQSDEVSDTTQAS